MAKSKGGGDVLYKALTFLMVGETRKSPGDAVSEEELEAVGQTKESIQELIDGGALSEDMDAPVNEAHAIPESAEVEAEGVIRSGDGGSGNA